MVSGSHASTRALLPPPPPFSLLKDTWCKLTRTSRETKGRKEREKKVMGQREEQTRQEDISDIAVRSEECRHFVPWSALPHIAIKTTQHHHRLPSPAASLQQHCHLRQTL